MTEAIVVINNGGKRMVMDHNHLGQEITSGGSNFRGVAHQSCNVNVRQQ
jgi:hypothetical protein